MVMGLSITTFIKGINYKQDWAIRGKLSRRFDKQTLSLLYDICCLLEPVSLTDCGYQCLFDCQILASQVMHHGAEYPLVAALSEVVTIETKK